MEMTEHPVWRGAKIVAGFALLVLGVLMLVLPGPGLVVIPLALAILAREFTWARRLLDRMKARAVKLRDSMHRRTG